MLKVSISQVVSQPKSSSQAVKSVRVVVNGIVINRNQDGEGNIKVIKQVGQTSNQIRISNTS